MKKRTAQSENHNVTHLTLQTFVSSDSSQQNVSTLNFKRSVKLLPYFFGFILLTLCLFSFLKIKDLNTNYSLDQFFPAQHKLIKQSEQIRKTFSLNDNAGFFVILQIPASQKETWLSPARMRELEYSTKKIQSLSQVKTILSLPKIETATQSQGALVIGTVFKNLKPADWASYTNKNPLIRSQLISPDHKSTLFIIEPKKLSPHQLEKLGLQIKKSIRSYSKKINIQVGGIPAIQSRFSNQLFQELKFYLAASTFGFALMFFFFISGWSSLLLAIATLASANVIAIGTLALMQIPFSVLLTTLPIVLSISILSVLIHTMHRWAEIRSEKMSALQTDALFNKSYKTIKEMFISNFLGTLTTAIGFAALYFADIPLIKQYGWVVALYVFAGWLYAQFVLFGFMHLTQPRLRSWSAVKAYWALFILKQSRFILALTASVCFVCVLQIPKMTFSSRLFDDLPKKDSVRTATSAVDKKMGGAVQYDVVLSSNQDGYFKAKNQILKVDQTLKNIRKISGVGSAISYSDFFEKKEKLSQQALLENFFLFSLAEKNPLKHFVLEDGKAIRISLRLHDLETRQIESLRRKVVKKLKSQFKNVKILETGIAVTSHTINKNVSKGLVYNFWHALLLVGLFLALIFKSIRWPAVAIIPNLLPPLVLMALMAYHQTPIKPGVALIFSIALGLAFNNTVYILVRLKKIMKEKNMTHLPLKRALTQEANPCLFESLIMLVGFSVFMFSDFEANQLFGTYMVVSILAGAFGDILFLPALLKSCPNLLKSQKKNEPLKVRNRPSSPAIEKIAASFALIIISLVFAGPQPVQATSDEAHTILESVKKNIESSDEDFRVKMKIIEPSGEVKERKMKIQTLTNEKFHALVRLDSPADVKGMAFLAIVDKENEDQWLYLPSSRQVRRLVGSQKSTGILGSELTVEDLNSTAIKGAKVKVISKNKKEIKIEALPKKGASLYSKAVVTISLEKNVPLKTEYYVKNKVVKRVAFLNYKKIKSIWRAHLIKVENLTNKRKTDLELSQIKLNSGLSEDDFTQSSLKP